MKTSLFVLFLVFITSTTAFAQEFRRLSLEMLEAAREGDNSKVKSLLEQGVPVGARNRFGNTALIYAARSGNQALVKLLLDMGADVSKSNVNGKTGVVKT